MRETREGFPHRWNASSTRKFSDVGDDAPARVVLASYDRDNGLGKCDHDADDGRNYMNNGRNYMSNVGYKVIDTDSDTRDNTGCATDNGRDSRMRSHKGSGDGKSFDGFDGLPERVRHRKRLSREKPGWR